MAGILYGIGVGPGDPELLTLKAVRLMEECDVIGIPARERENCTAWQIAVRAVPSIAHKPVLAVPVPMTKDREKLAQAYEQGAKALMDMLESGRTVTFLNLGDPTVYGSYMELHRRVIGAGFEACVVSGVPSFCAVAGALGQPLGDGKEAVHILPGSYSLDGLEALSGTKVFMKSGSRIGAVRQQLLSLQEKTGAELFAVTNCGMDNQKIYEDIGQLDEDAGYFTTILMKDHQ